MFRTIGTLAMILGLAASSYSAVEQDLETAAKSGKVAFILIYDQTAIRIEQARQIVEGACQRLPGSVAIEVDRNDASNAEFVAKYKVATAPVPLVLVASSTGVITTGLVIEERATVDYLVKTVPSAKKAEIVKALSERNAVIVTVSRKGMTAADAVNTACMLACQQMSGKSVQVEIDMDDPAEASFLSELKVNRASTEPVTLVANAQGQIAGIYTGEVQVSELVAAATKKVGGCCPSTVSNPNATCAPTK